MKSDTGRHAYEICVHGHLDQHWKAWFDGWTIVELENGDTLLENTWVDQPALHAILNKIRDINLTLLSVKRRN